MFTYCWLQVEEDGDVSILHITGVTHLDGGEVKCTAAKQSKSASSAEAVSCSTQLSVVPDLDLIGVFEGNSCSAASMEALNGVSSGVNGGVMVSEINEPAMLLRKPQDTTALVGDRVLLKATYIGHPEPTVRWTRAVSTECFQIPFSQFPKKRSCKYLLILIQVKYLR